MKNCLYIECLSGISGDMTIGALLDLGINQQRFLEELSKLKLEGYTLHIYKAQKQGITGTKFDVLLEQADHDHHDHHHHETNHHDHHHDHDHHDHHHAEADPGHQEAADHHHHRNILDIYGIIDGSQLKERVKTLSKEMFRHVAEAEAKIHGKALEEVHFHEVGAIDSIVDIVGAAIAIDLLEIDEIISTPVHTGTGFVKCAHGKMPVPAPATLEILKGLPLYSTGIRSELVTPTGAAILKTLVHDFGPRPEMIVEKIGYGLGTKDLEIANVLRMSMGKKKQAADHWVLECNIDDMNPEWYESVMGHLFEKGALDVYMVPMHMKKNRPATLLSLICKAEHIPALSEILLTETTTFGLRKYPVEREILDRQFIQLDTAYGPITLKLGIYQDKIIKAAPEYEDCKRASQQHGVSLMTVYQQAMVAYGNIN